MCLSTGVFDPESNCEAQHSLVGTGTEDWFTDAWNMRVFTNANVGVTIKKLNVVDC